MTSLTGLGRLLRFTVRRDRVRLLLWVLGITALFVASAVSVRELYPTQSDIDTYVALFGDNPALVAFAGPGYGFDDPNLGVILVNETQVFGGIAMALMSMFLVTRQTRAEEESERADLIRANVVGRHAPTAASITVVGGANLLVGVVGAVAFVALGYQVAGSIALAGSMTAVGLMFAGITAVAAQLSSTGRGALGITAIALGATFALRAAGDIGDTWVRWLSPMGWANGVRAFADERWLLLVLCIAVSALLVVGGFWLSTRRDLGAGLIPARGGEPTAPRWMVRPIGLTLRLQRGAILGWMAGLFAMGIVFGAIGEDIDDMLEDNPAIADFFAQMDGTTLTDSFFATSMVMLAVVASGYAIAGSLAARTEEMAGRAESLLTRPLPRSRWLLGHLAVTIGGAMLAVGASGLGFGVAYAIVVSDPGQVPRLVLASLTTIPAVLVMVGVATALYGLFPRAALGAWAALAYVAVIAYFAELLRLPGWARGLSPFHHLPAVPAVGISWPPVLLLGAVAVALVAAGVAGLQRRDLSFG